MTSPVTRDEKEGGGFRATLKDTVTSNLIKGRKDSAHQDITSLEPQSPRKTKLGLRMGLQRTIAWVF